MNFIFVVAFKVWITRIKRDPKKDFKVTESTKVCSEHFTPDDFISSSSQKRKLKNGACPSVFSWTSQAQERSLPSKRSKLQEEQEILEAEITATASEGEGKFDETDRDNYFSRATQVDIEVPCTHRFSINILRSLCDSPEREVKYFSHFTGFKSYERFRMVLEFFLPDFNRSNIVSWDSKGAKQVRIDPNSLFDSDTEMGESSSESSEEEDPVTNDRKYCSNLSVEDDFLLVLMKLRLGLSTIDLAVRFNVSEATVSKLFTTWINYIYVRLGDLKIWPHRNVIIANMPPTFKEKYPNTVIIIDATELRIQTPSSLLRQSQSYSSYKSTNTFKSLIGVDAKGGIVFVSQLYTGSISDKEIVIRSGFLDILKSKVAVGEILAADAVMADKGFDIGDELKKVNLRLNIPPFLANQSAFSEGDVIKTQTVAQHQIHIERAIGKVRRFQIFSNEIPVTMFGNINQIWTVCCMLSNFIEPILE